MFKKILLLFVICLFALNKNSFGATKGALGTTSESTITITLILNPIFQVSSLNDVVLSYTPGIDRGNLEEKVTFCIHTKDKAKNYTAKVFSFNSDGNVFRTYNGAGNYLEYTVEWANDISFESLTIVKPGSEIKGNIAEGKNNQCANAYPAGIKIVFKEADLINASRNIEGFNYTDILTTVVAPE